MEIREEDFRRIIRGFHRLSEIWLELGNDFKPGGHRSYALQKSAAFNCMAKESEKLFKAAGGTWPAEGETLFDLIRRQRQQRRRSVSFSSSSIAVIQLKPTMLIGHLMIRVFRWSGYQVGLDTPLNSFYN